MNIPRFKIHQRVTVVDCVPFTVKTNVQCIGCNSKGFILIDGEKLVCPNCKGKTTNREGYEYRVIYKNVYVAKTEDTGKEGVTYYILNKSNKIYAYNEQFVFKNYREASNFCEAYIPIKDGDRFIPHKKRVLV